MQRVRVRGTPPPSAPKEPTYQVLRTQRDGPLDVTFLEDTVLGLAAHYVIADEGGPSTVLCTQYEPGGCMHHDESDEWCGFVAVWWHTHAKRAVLRLAPGEMDELMKKMGTDVDWRGQRRTLQPVNNGRGKAIAVITPDTQVGASRCEPHDVERTVCALFRVAKLPRQTPEPADPGVEVPLQ